MSRKSGYRFSEKDMRKQTWRSRRLLPLVGGRIERDVDYAAQSVGIEIHAHRAPELGGDAALDEARAEARPRRRFDRRAVALAPFDMQQRRLRRPLLDIPADFDASLVQRQRAVFCGV